MNTLSDNLAAKISQIDLNRIHENLRRKERWSDQKIKQNTSEYRKFLYLLGKHGGILVPWTDDMDTVWHYHMLDSKLYRKHCEELFGRYIDHDPLLSNSESEHRQSFERTKQLYIQEFGYKEKKSLWQRVNEKYERNNSDWTTSNWDVPISTNTNQNSTPPSPNDTTGHETGNNHCDSVPHTDSSHCGSSCGSSCGSGCGGG